MFVVLFSVLLVAGCCVVFVVVLFGSVLGLVVWAITKQVLPMHRKDNKVFFIFYDF